jgi:uncharacterized membrane protein YqjE
MKEKAEIKAILLATLMLVCVGMIFAGLYLMKCWL